MAGLGLGRMRLTAIQLYYASWPLYLRYVGCSKGWVEKRANDGMKCDENGDSVTLLHQPATFHLSKSKNSL